MNCLFFLFCTVLWGPLIMLSRFVHFFTHNLEVIGYFLSCFWLNFSCDVGWPKSNVNSTSNINVKLMSNTDVSWRWDFVVFRLCNQNPTSNWRQILTSTRFSFSTKMQRLSDVMPNVNLTLHRRLVPAGLVSQFMTPLKLA